MQIKLILGAIFVLFSIITNSYSISEEDEKVLPRRIILCSGKEISPFITYIKIDSLEAAGTCYGYANCTACTTCNYCSHCNSGGRCGVCSNMSSYKPPNIVRPSVPVVHAEPITPVGKPINKDYLYITHTDVNLRSESNTTSSINAKLQIGDKVSILEKSYSTYTIPNYGTYYWYRVMTDENDEGWVFGKFILDESQLSNTAETERLKVEGAFTYIKGDGVNVRMDPSTLKNNIITQLNINDKCIIVERTTSMVTIFPYGDDYWYKVEYGNISGWIFGKFLSEESIGTKYGVATINGTFVNLRLQPVIDATIMGRVYRGDKCMILDKSEFQSTIAKYGTNYWFKIRTSRNEGWVFGEFISFE